MCKCMDVDVRRGRGNSSCRAERAGCVAEFQRPPAGAVDLLGRPCLHRNGESSRWVLDGGTLEINPGSGDVYFDLSLSAFQLHLEFWLPHMPDAEGQDRANSGVYLDGRFEIQLLDSAGQAPKADTCGAIYERRRPDWDAALPPERWQALDVAYRRREPGARLTALLNGVLIHNQVLVNAPTQQAYLAEPRPVILLQDHEARVRFRSIWVLASE